VGGYSDMGNMWALNRGEGLDNDVKIPLLSLLIRQHVGGKGGLWEGVCRRRLEHLVVLLQNFALLLSLIFFALR